MGSSQHTSRQKSSRFSLVRRLLSVVLSIDSSAAWHPLRGLRACPPVLAQQVIGPGTSDPGTAHGASLPPGRGVYCQRRPGKIPTIILWATTSFPEETFMATVTELQVNGTKHRLETDAGRSLLSVLRDDLNLTGVKYGCGEGRCGACTVMIDGKATRSCTTLLDSCAGNQITTIEGLERDGKLHPLQEAFLEVGSMQCGYCTPGMIMSGVALLN